MHSLHARYWHNFSTHTEQNECTWNLLSEENIEEHNREMYASQKLSPNKFSGFTTKLLLISVPENKCRPLALVQYVEVGTGGYTEMSSILADQLRTERVQMREEGGGLRGLSQ